MRYRHKHQPVVLILPKRLTIVTEWKRDPWGSKQVPAKIETGEVGMALVATPDLQGNYTYSFMQPDELREHFEQEDEASGPEMFVHEVRRVKPPLPAHAIAETHSK